MNILRPLHGFRRSRAGRSYSFRPDVGGLDAFFTSAPAGLLIRGSDLRLLKVNDTMADILGLPPKEMTSETPRALAPLLAPKFEPILLNVSETGKPVLNFPLSGETSRFPGVIRHWVGSVFPICRERNRKWTIGAIALEVTDHRQFEKVRKGEALLAEAEELANLGSWEHDLVTGDETWSAGLCHLLGQEAIAGKISGQKFWEFLHPDDREMVRSVIEWGMKDLEPYEYQARFMLPDGRERLLFTRGKPVLDSSNKIVKRIGVTQDVTERIEAQRALRESEERYRDLVENSRDLICTHDLQGRLLSMNELPAQILGYRREQLIGRCIEEILAPEVRGKFDRYISQIKRNGHAEGQMMLKTASGERRIWLYKNTLRTEGTPNPIVRGMARDVTEEVAAEVALRESKGRLQALISSIDEIVFECAADGTFLDIWTTNESLLFRPREEMLGKRISEVISDEFSRPFQAAFCRVLANGIGEDLEYTQPVGGSERWFLARATPIAASDGSYKTICVVVRDITSRKDAEEKLRQKESTIRSLLRISIKLNAILDVDAILDSVVHEAMDLAGANGGGSAIKTPQGLVGNCFFASSAEKGSRFSWDVNTGATRWVLESKLPYLSNTAFEDPQISPVARELLKLRHVLVTPVLDAGGEVIAVFGIHNKQNGLGFTESDKENVLGLARITAIALQNALAYRKIQQGEQEMHRLSARLLQMQDDERRRIAGQLHETTAQDLAALAMKLGQVKRVDTGLAASTEKIVDECLETSNQIIQGIRTLSYLLHPPLLEETGLASAVPWYVAGFIERSGIEVRLELSENIGRLPRECETTLFRIMQECLTNIHRHSGSQWARIQIHRASGFVSLEVEDRGHGMAGEKAGRSWMTKAFGVGIAGIRERVKQLDGMLEIKSAPGKGTMVCVVLPLE
jgi:PAS domain S-box-containing protein